MKIAAYLIEKIGSAASGYFHPSLWLSESHELLVSQGNHRIDAHRPPCRDVASECGDSDQNERCEKHRLNICGLHTKKQGGHEACYANSASNTRTDSNQSYRNPPPEDDPNTAQP